MQAIAGEALIVHIFQHVDMLLRYVQYKVLRVSKSNRTFEWTQQAWATNTDSEVCQVRDEVCHISHMSTVLMLSVLEWQQRTCRPGQTVR